MKYYSTVSAEEATKLFLELKTERKEIITIAKTAFSGRIFKVAWDSHETLESVLLKRAIKECSDITSDLKSSILDRIEQLEQHERLVHCLARTTPTTPVYTNNLLVEKAKALCNTKF